MLILSGGFLLFNEQMPVKKLAGVMLAMVGIIWYSTLKMQKSGPSPAASGKSPGRMPQENEPLVAKDKPKQAVPGSRCTCIAPESVVGSGVLDVSSSHCCKPLLAPLPRASLGVVFWMCRAHTLASCCPHGCPGPSVRSSLSRRLKDGAKLSCTTGSLPRLTRAQRKAHLQCL